MVLTVPLWWPYAVAGAVALVVGLILFLRAAVWHRWLFGLVLAVMSVGWSGAEWSYHVSRGLSSTATKEVVEYHQLQVNEDKAKCILPVQCAAALCLGSIAFGVMCCVMASENYVPKS